MRCPFLVSVHPLPSTYFLIPRIFKSDLFLFVCRIVPGGGVTNCPFQFSSLLFFWRMFHYDVEPPKRCSKIERMFTIIVQSVIPHSALSFQDRVECQLDFSIYSSGGRNSVWRVLKRSISNDGDNWRKAEGRRCCVRKDPRYVTKMLKRNSAKYRFTCSGFIAKISPSSSSPLTFIFVTIIIIN